MRRLGQVLPNKGPYTFGAKNIIYTTNFYLTLGMARKSSKKKTSGNRMSKSPLFFLAQQDPPELSAWLLGCPGYSWVAGLFLPHHAPRSAEDSQLCRDEEIPGHSRLAPAWVGVDSHYFASPKREYHHPTRRYHHNNCRYVQVLCDESEKDTCQWWKRSNIVATRGTEITIMITYNTNNDHPSEPIG